MAALLSSRTRQKYRTDAQCHQAEREFDLHGGQYLHTCQVSLTDPVGRFVWTTVDGCRPAPSSSVFLPHRVTSPCRGTTCRSHRGTCVPRRQVQVLLYSQVKDVQRSSGPSRHRMSELDSSGVTQLSASALLIFVWITPRPAALPSRSYRSAACPQVSTASCGRPRAWCTSPSAVRA